MTLSRLAQDVEGQPGRPRTGDFLYYYEGATAARTRQDLYAYGSRTFPNPPMIAAAMAPLSTVDERDAARLWLPINLAALALAAVVGARQVVRRLGVSADAAFVPAVVLVSVLLTFDQCRWTIVRGNVDSLVLLPIVLGLAWLDRRPLLAGLALGLAANVKYLSLALVPWMLVRGRFRAAAAVAGGTVLCALLPALVLGWTFNLEMIAAALRGLERLVGGEGAAAAGQANVIAMEARDRGVSLTHFILRLGADGRWPAGLTLAVVAALAAACLGVAWLIYARAGVALWRGRFGEHTGDAAGPAPGATGPAAGDDRARRDRLVLLEWLGVVVALLVFSPHTEVRHTVLLLPVHALAAAVLLDPRTTARARMGLLGVVVSQLAFRLPPGDGFDEALRQWRYVGGSSWGMLVMYFGLLWATLQPRRSQARGA